MLDGQVDTDTFRLPVQSRLNIKKPLNLVAKQKNNTKAALKRKLKK